LVFSDLKIADREILRRKHVEKKLDYISRQLGQLDIVKRLPAADVLSQSLVNRTIDVVSATLHYLAVHIEHESTRLGLIGTDPFQF
jgi:hypothetical protein